MMKKFPNEIKLVLIEHSKHKILYDHGFTFYCDNDRDKDGSYFGYDKSNIQWWVIELNIKSLSWDRWNWYHDENEFTKLFKAFYL